MFVFSTHLCLLSWQHPNTKKVASDHDAGLLQSDLYALYSWDKLYNMELNNNIFEHMCYCTRLHTTVAHTYTVYQGVKDITSKEHVRDLGVS